jgi:hypothetical protein
MVREAKGGEMSDELKPCPFCGEKAEIRVKQWIDGEGYPDKLVWVECPDCGDTHRPDNWNTRPIEDALRAELETAYFEKAEFQESNTRLREALGRAHQQRDALKDELEQARVRLAEAEADAERLYHAIKSEDDETTIEALDAHEKRKEGGQ